MIAVAELNMIARHAARRLDRDAPVRAAERSDIANRVHGVGFGDGVTMGQLLRYASSEHAHPELQRRLVALTALTYRRGNPALKPRNDGTRSGHEPRAAASSPPSRSPGGIEYGRPVSGLRMRPADIAKGRAIAATFADYVD